MSEPTKRKYLKWLTRNRQSRLTTMIESTWLTSPSGRLLHAPHHLTLMLLRSLAGRR